MLTYGEIAGLAALAIYLVGVVLEAGWVIDEWEMRSKFGPTAEAESTTMAVVRSVFSITLGWISLAKRAHDDRKYGG